MKEHAEYGRDYQLEAADKYRNREKNHWKIRIKLARELVEKYALPRLCNKPKQDIIIVDVGCSVGTFAIEFAKLGYKTFGVDFDDHAIEISQKLSVEEGVTAKFVKGDVSVLNDMIELVDIAICFDIFEHLHSDELGSFLSIIKKRLSANGCIVFHTFPTYYDYIFYRAAYRRFLPLLFRKLSINNFNRIVKTYSLFIDIYLILKTGRSYSERISHERHCNPTTEERLTQIFMRAGYELICIRSDNIYQYKKLIQNKFVSQPITYRNLYGVAIPNNAIMKEKKIL